MGAKGFYHLLIDANVVFVITYSYFSHWQLTTLTQHCMYMVCIDMAVATACT